MAEAESAAIAGAAAAAIDGEKLLRRPQLAAFAAQARGRFMPNADMSKITWFRAGGPAELLYQPADEEDLAAFLRALPADVPLLTVGIGSNLLVRDGGIKGAVLRLSAKGFGAITAEGNRLTVGAAASDKRLAQAALAAGLGGFAFYHGIPGGVGGALRMNAGASGGETAGLVAEVHALDRQGNQHILSGKQMGFAYRHCGAPAELIFTKVIFAGKPAERAEIETQMAAVQSHRETAQPIREKTGGSTFRNPEGHSAWKLIEAAGCRGLKIGGAQMSEMHCNFMINTGAATAYDLEALGEEVRRRVFAASGIKLQWEIKRLGQFTPGHIVAPAF